MARPFEFRRDVVFSARVRQRGRCAVLGCDLNQTVEHGHHVVPNQSGDPGNVADSWIASVDNCVVLCSTCHNRVHQDGHYRSGAVAPASYFAFSHGPGAEARMQHQSWAWALEVRAQSVWDRLGQG
jgi:hypothetical protein